MSDRERTQRNLNPSPEAVFAMYHWHTSYAAKRGGSMDFWDGLNEREQQYCRDAVAAIRRAVEARHE